MGDTETDSASGLHTADLDPCENCAALRTSPLCCEKCGALYPVPPDIDDFAIFGIAPTFAIDEDELESRVLELSSLLHPDHYAAALPAEQTLAAEHTARVNDAHRRLTDRRARAAWLLARLASPEVAESRETEPGLFEEILELREEVEEIADTPRADRADAQRDRLAAIGADMRARLDRAWQTVADTLAALERADTPETIRDRSGLTARRALNAVRYYENLADEAQRLLDGHTDAATPPCRP